MLIWLWFCFLKLILQHFILCVSLFVLGFQWILGFKIVFSAWVVNWLRFSGFTFVGCAKEFQFCLVWTILWSVIELDFQVVHFATLSHASVRILWFCTDSYSLIVPSALTIFWPGIVLLVLVSFALEKAPLGGKNEWWLGVSCLKAHGSGPLCLIYLKCSSCLQDR